MIRFIIITQIGFCGIAASSFAQEDSSAQNLYFVRKNGEVIFNKNDYQPGRNAFYIYRNCIYTFVLADKKTVPAHVIDIRNDSIYFTRYTGIVTQQGLDKVYEQRETASYYEGTSKHNFEDTLKKNMPPVIKKWAWVTPTNVNKISGLNLGLQTWTFADNDSLVIHGVNLNADLLTTFVVGYAIARLTRADLPDTVDKTNMKSKIAGLSISGGGVIGNFKMCGLAINGIVSGVTEVNGVQITCLLNVSEEFKGVMIGGLCNASTKGRGLQISLFNMCKDLKGIQLGLWNVNNKRKLPIINWDF